MKIQNVRNLPVATNVCEQVLREVERQPNWSLAHVIMNPMAWSLLHDHEQMREIYVVTKGFGELALDVRGKAGPFHQVLPGSVIEIPKGVPHLLKNRGAGHLEHLVFAFPPFDPSDTRLLPERTLESGVHPFHLANPQDCYDGAKIIPYEFPHLDLSIAFGWTINDPKRKKQPHYHKKATEFVYVVEGKGFIEQDGVREPIQSGDWIQIDRGVLHGLINESPEDMVVVCVCSPAFRMDDVYYRQ